MPEPRPDVVLRELEDGDLDAVFEQMRDPESAWMAAFTSKEPLTREVFDAHRARIAARTDVTERAILSDGVFAGTIASFVQEGDTELTYWIDRSLWGRGIASEALAQFLRIVTVRPLHGRAASDNLGSLRVMQKAGFRVVGTDTGYAGARNAEIEETVLRLD